MTFYQYVSYINFQKSFKMSILNCKIDD